MLDEISRNAAICDANFKPQENRVRVLYLALLNRHLENRIRPDSPSQSA